MFKLMIVFLFVCNSIFGSIPMSVQTPPSLKTNLGAYLDKIVQLPMMNIKGMLCLISELTKMARLMMLG